MFLASPGGMARGAEAAVVATKGVTMHWVALSAYALLSLTTACGEGPGRGKNPGRLTVLLNAGPTFALEAGGGGLDTDDGYRVSYSRYIVSVGLVSMSKSEGRDHQDSDAIAIADLTRIGSTPPVVTVFDRIPVGPYPSFAFATPAPDANASNINAVPQLDVESMIANGWTFIVEGQVARAADDVVREFVIQADVPADYSDCADAEKQGVGVGSKAKTVITIHGDHLFFTGFPRDEAQAKRLAQWVWEVEDVDGDGVLTRSDFQAAEDIDRMFPPSRYSLQGGPLLIENAWDFVRAQLATAGHLRENGDCNWGEL